MTPHFGTRPNVTFSPVCPLNDAGPRTEPPVSVPIPPSTIPVATAIPVPEDDPPAVRSRSHGFRGVGNGFSASGAPIANSDITSLPMITAPPARSRSVTTESYPSPHAGSSTSEFAVVGWSAVASRSLSPNGIPCSGPRSIRAASCASARSAWIRAAWFSARNAPT